MITARANAAEVGQQHPSPPLPGLNSVGAKR